MPRFDDTSPDPGVEAALAVIDATLAGDAVEPEHAELAELTLILAGERPAPSEEWARRARRAGRRRDSRGGDPMPTGGTGRGRRRRRWLYAPGAAVGLAAAVAVVVVLLSSGGGSRQLGHGHVGDRARRRHRVRARLGRRAVHALRRRLGDCITVGGRRYRPAAASPPTSGRQVVQSAQLSLSTRPDQVDDVAQQVFDVVSAQNGVVENSTVTAANSASGYAQFQLSVPSANLAADDVGAVAPARRVGRLAHRYQPGHHRSGRGRRAAAGRRAGAAHLAAAPAGQRDHAGADQQPAGPDPGRRGLHLQRSGHAAIAAPQGRQQPDLGHRQRRRRSPATRCRTAAAASASARRPTTPAASWWWRPAGR